MSFGAIRGLSMKLLYILPEYLPDSGGGIITFYGQLLPALMDAGNTVKVLVCNHQTLDKPSLILNGVEIEYLKSSYVEQARLGCRKFDNPTFWAFLPLAWGAFAQAHGGEGYDIVEPTDWGLLFMPWVVSERKAKVVVSLHGSNGQVNWFSNLDLQSFEGDVVRLCEVAALQLADSIHANSRVNAAFWHSKTNREIRVIPPLIEFSEFITSQAHSSHGLVVGRLQSLKGVELLCRSLQLVDGSKIEWVGSDSAWGNFGEMASQFLRKTYPLVWGSKLQWLGPMTYAEAMKKISEAGYLVIASIFDVFNMTALEAIARGIPVICSKAAGAEMLIEHGRNGFLFDPEKPENLADRLKLVASMTASERIQMGQRAQDSVKALLNKERIVALLEESYRDVMKSSNPPRIDAWAASLLSPSSKQNPKPKPGFARRVMRKVVKFFNAL